MHNVVMGPVAATDERAPGNSVWVVDDTPAVRLLVAHSFARAGWQVTEFEDLNTALAALSSRSAPAAVILDVHLPDGCGLDNVRAFSDAGTAVVVVSNLVGPEQVERAFAAGAVDIVTKPIDLRILLARVERSLRKVSEGSAMRSSFTFDQGDSPTSSTFATSEQ